MTDEQVRTTLETMIAGWPAVTRQELAEYVRTRPDSIKRLMARFPPGTHVVLPGRKHRWVTGWNEGGMLILGPADPRWNVEVAYSRKEYLCASHLEEGHSCPECGEGGGPWIETNRSGPASRN